MEGELKLIITKLQGGLGNQMFQYAMAREIQNINNKTIVLDISDYVFDEQRNYSLDKFYLNSDVIIDGTGKYNKLYDRRNNKIIKLLTTILPNLSYLLFSKFGIYIWDSVQYKKININYNKKNIYLHGYWQSKNYFKTIGDILKEDLKVKKLMDEENNDIYEQIINSNSVCVHIRRGDFLLAKNGLKVCSEKYFLNAMEIITEKVENPSYFIFSDDIKDVKENFDFSKYNVIFVEKNNNDYEELRLMYSCKHFIISNSTFSWWAQYLCDYKDKNVIAPSEWYVDGRSNELLDCTWTILEP